MKRKQLMYLQEWLSSRDRKPMVIRGARQVGKTWLVRHFAKLQNKQLVEVNFEKRPTLAALFESNNPKQILINLSSSLNIPIDPQSCLLFLDEIQAAPEILAKLRWFAEELPQLPVIAAGSLLEFVLKQHSFSMPVGRINYMHLEPLSFEEFLLANDRQLLLDYLIAFEWESTIPSDIHLQLMQLFKEYIIVGGMPAVVASWIAEHSLQKMSQIQQELMATYRDDFAKYRGRIESERLDEILNAVPRLLGEKFVYSQVNPDIRSHILKEAFELTCRARICHRITSCHANGLPLGAELDEKYFKAIFLDIGLCSAALGYTMSQMISVQEINLINKGGIAEQAVGQILRTVDFPYMHPDLYYWVRNEKGSSAEIDYLIQHGNRIIPIEVKAGTTGTLKSLHLFMGIKKLTLAIRVNSNIPKQSDVQVKDQLGNEIEYKLLNIPFYLLGQVHRLIHPSY